MKHAFVEKYGKIEFVEPSPKLVQSDSREFRKRILELTQKQARELGIRESTLHYLRKHARDDKPFKIYQKVGAKLR